MTTASMSRMSVVLKLKPTIIVFFFRSFWLTVSLNLRQRAKSGCVQAQSRRQSDNESGCDLPPTSDDWLGNTATPARHNRLTALRSTARQTFYLRNANGSQRPCILKPYVLPAHCAAICFTCALCSAQQSHIWDVPR